MVARTQARAQSATQPRPVRRPVARPRVTAAELRNEILAAWMICRDAVGTEDKAAIRDLHLMAKFDDRAINYQRLLKDLSKLRMFFPSPARIEPERIDPILVPVGERSLEERLFKVVRGFWSMPYSKGYGRRLRYLVLDQYHNAVIGIIGLQSPSADLACRDNYLGAPKEHKLRVVNNTLDAYTIGATPAYAPVLGGKLTAGMLHAPVIRQDYWRTYGNQLTTQLQLRVPQPLLAITTASAFGRSSIYNRLRLDGRMLAKPLGYTKGFGTLHLEGLYPKITAWLEQTGRCVPAGFGNGPKVRWQNIMRALVALKMPRKCLEHGLQREVFIFELVANLQAVCAHGDLPEPIPFDVTRWADHWKERWCLPRVERTPEWYEFNAYGILESSLAAQLRQGSKG